MGKYELFGQCVVFTDSAERFFDMQQAFWDARAAATEEFKQWYQSCSDIATVLKNYPKRAATLVAAHANDPLFSQLTDIGIYDISRASYDSECFDCSGIAEAFDEIAAKYNTIIDDKEAAMEYREYRKASRGRVVGGGFGVGGALKGMATAGAMNAVAGAGHSVANAVGNAFSAIEAASAKRALYNSADTLSTLIAGICTDILAGFNAHMNLVNDCIDEYIHSTFDSDRASALFESAKKVQDKRQELLLESFQNCPWNEDLLTYIFENHPSERKNIWLIAKRFQIDLCDLAEDIISKMYTEQDATSEATAQKSKQQIVALMTELDITTSDTLDQLEKDCVMRLLYGYHEADAKTRENMFAAVKEYDAAPKNKASVVHSVGVWELAKYYKVEFSPAEAEEILARIYTKSAKQSEAEAQKAKAHILEAMAALNLGTSETFNQLERDCISRLCPNIEAADESACNKMLSDVESYDARSENKQDFINRIQKRIEAIWSAEDGEIFDNLYCKTDLYSTEEIDNAIEFIKTKGRTSSSEKYINALKASNAENIKKAIAYKKPITRAIATTGAIVAILGIVLLFVGLGVVLGLAVCALGITMLLYVNSLKQMWNTLTIGGAVLHPMLSKNIPNTTDSTDKSPIKEEAE